MKDFFYKVQDFYFPEERGVLGSWAFTSEIDPFVASEAFSLQISEVPYTRLIEMGERIVHNSGLVPSGMPFPKPYQFMENEEGDLTCLLQYAEVSGVNSCSFGMDPNERRRILMPESRVSPIVYSSHNVDSLPQAFALLSLWLNWANLLEALLSNKG
jgi:hypothetical protein